MSTNYTYIYKSIQKCSHKAYDIVLLFVKSLHYTLHSPEQQPNSPKVVFKLLFKLLMLLFQPLLENSLRNATKYFSLFLISLSFLPPSSLCVLSHSLSLFLCIALSSVFTPSENSLCLSLYRKTLYFS